MLSKSTASPQVTGGSPESLAKLRSLVEHAMTNGKISPQEADGIRVGLTDNSPLTLHKRAVVNERAVACVPYVRY